MTRPARVSFVTLAVRDLPGMAAFYRQFGWPESATNSDHHVAFQCGGAILGLYGAHNYEADLGPAPADDEFKGFTLAVNLEDAGAVDRAYETVKGADGATVLSEPQDLLSAAVGSSSAIRRGTSGTSSGRTARRSTSAAG